MFFFLLILLFFFDPGFLFQLLDAKNNPPPLGFGPTAAISLVGAPTCLFLFVAAIQKGAAETEEDDRKFNAGGGGSRY